LIQDRDFENEKIELDGKNFQSCRFRNVTFVFRGKHPFSLSNNALTRPLFLETNFGPNYQAARSVLDLAQMLVKTGQIERNNLYREFLVFPIERQYDRPI